MCQNVLSRHHVLKFLSSSCPEISAPSVTLDVALTFWRNPHIMIEMSTVTWIFPIWPTRPLPVSKHVSKFSFGLTAN